MSGAPRPDAARDVLFLDVGVLDPGPVFEIGGTAVADQVGGEALVHWRGQALAAGDVTLVDQPPPAGRYKQVVVHVGKGRAAIDYDIASACAALTPGGRLLIQGRTDQGIVSLGKRLQQHFGQAPEVLANRARARVIAFTQISTPFPFPAPQRVPLDSSQALAISVEPGVFSGDGLDAGTALLQESLARCAPGKRVVDLGCGAGHLALFALHCWPSATALLLDADRRAVRSAKRNVDELGLSTHATCKWWDVSEGSAGEKADVVLLNPPCHAGHTNDLSIAQALFAVAAELIADGGQALIVANRNLPYETALKRHGVVTVLDQRAGFKVLSLTCQ